MHLSKPIDYTTPRKYPNVNCGCQLIIYKYWLTNCNECTSLIQDINNKKHCMPGLEVEVGTWHFVLCAQLFCILKLYSKNKVYLFFLKKKNIQYRNGRKEGSNCSPFSTEKILDQNSLTHDQIFSNIPLSRFGSILAARESGK